MKRDAANLRGMCPACGSVTSNDTISTELQTLIKGAGVTQKDVALEMKISAQYLNDVMNGRRDWRPELVNRVRAAVRALAKGK